MKKILCSLVMLFASMFLLIGCAKSVSTETSTVQVKVTNEYHHESYTIPYYNSVTKTTYLQPYPATYEIVVEYDGAEYILWGKDIYNKYSGRVGEYVTGTLETKRYDNGTVKYEITSLE